MDNKINFAVIAAGGTGSRLGGDLPKQYLLLNDKPVLMHSIKQYHNTNPKIRIILVIANSMIEYWKQLCQEYNFDIPHEIVHAGLTRFQSIQNAVKYIQKEYHTSAHMISVHDGARPLVTQKIIENSYIQCESYHSAVAAIASTNSIRLGTSKESQSYDREKVWIIQTPQVFDASLLFDAYDQKEDQLFTDDASVVEKMGKSITLIEGDRRNIKITYKEDLAIAQLYLNNE